MIIRDITGRYSWDTKLFYKEYLDDKQNNVPKHYEIAKCMKLRPNIKIEPSSRLESSYVLFIYIILHMYYVFFILNSFLYLLIIEIQIHLQGADHVIEQVIFIKIKIDYLFGLKTVTMEILIC